MIVAPKPFRGVPIIRGQVPVGTPMKVWATWGFGISRHQTNGDAARDAGGANNEVLKTEGATPLAAGMTPRPMRSEPP
jgi:hypothetical protein